MSEEMFLVVDFNSICRFCLEPKGILSNIFDGSNYDTPLVDQISFITDLSVRADDDLPTKVCHRCRYKIEQCFEFRNMMLQSQKTLQGNSSLDLARTYHDWDRNGEGQYCQIKEEKQADGADNMKEKSECELPKIEYSGENCDDNNYDTKIYGKNIEFLLQNIEEAEMVKTIDEKKNQSRKSLRKGRSKKRDENDYPSMFTAYKKNQCLLCLEKYNDKESLHRHVDRHVEGTMLEPYYLLKDRNINCKYCGKFFNYRYNFLAHQREHLNIKPFICQYQGCNAAFSSNNSLRQHLPIHADRNFICSTCGLGFKRKSDLRGHEIIHEDAGLLFHCNLCGLICKNRLTHAAHVKKHQTSPKYKCDHCPKEYFSRSELSRHVHIHSTVKKFGCNMCSCAYYSQSALNRHKKHHWKQRTHRCFICSELCQSWGQFTDHMKQHRPEEFPYKCPNCQKGYFIKTSLNRHMLVCKNSMGEESQNVDHQKGQEMGDVQSGLVIINMMEDFRSDQAVFSKADTGISEIMMNGDNTQENNN